MSAAGGPDLTFTLQGEGRPLSLVSCATTYVAYFSFLMIRLQFISFYPVFGRWTRPSAICRWLINQTKECIQHFLEHKFVYFITAFYFPQGTFINFVTWTTAKRDYLLKFIMRYNRLSSSWWKTPAVYMDCLVIRSACYVVARTCCQLFVTTEKGGTNLIFLINAFI